MKRLLVRLFTLSAAMSASTSLLAQDRDPYLGKWAGKGTLQSTDSELGRPIVCRYRGTGKVKEMLIRLRCATRQKTQVVEVRLVYGETNQIIAAEVVRPIAQAGQSLDVQQDAAGLRIAAPDGAQLTLTRVHDTLKLSMIEPGRGRAEVRLNRL